MRAPFAADADHERLLVVDAAQQTFGAFGKQTMSRALEKRNVGRDSSESRWSSSL